MVSLISGKTIILYEKSQVGTDDFGAPIYEEHETLVDNILIEPASNEAIVSELQLSGKHVSYVLHIPKSDTHDWKDATVYFYGQKWKTYGDAKIYDEDLTPLSWNKQVMVERYEQSYN